MNTDQKILKDWTTEKGSVIKTFMKNAGIILTGFSGVKKIIIKTKGDTFSELTDRARQASALYLDRQSEESFGFNYFHFFDTPECTHSALLKDLLDPQGSHGQGTLFLSLLLQQLDMQNAGDAKWTAAVEKQQVDVLLKCRETAQVIIIENKSHNAVDQPNQLYRYWYYNMFVPYRFLFGGKDFPQELPTNFRIVYLVANEWKKLQMYESQSLEKPGHISDHKAPERIPEEWVTIFRFNRQINSLIDEALKIIRPGNHRLREYLYQYKELINELN